MAESMQGLHRSHRCTEVNNTMIGNTVTVMGWVQKSRNKGGIIFVDLRDRSGILQVIFEEANCGAESFAKAEKLRSEFVVAITGEVAKRGGAVNENLATGDIEVIAKDIRILAEADTLCKYKQIITYDGGGDDFTAIQNETTFDYKKLGAEMLTGNFALDSKMSELNQKWKDARTKLGIQ